MKIKKNIYLLYAISLLQGMIFYGPIATLYRQAAGVSVFQITLIESISLALCIVLELPWGIVADKIGYKKTMIISCGLYFLSKIVFWRADSFGGFLLERVMLSVVMAGLSGCDVSILYLSCEEGESHKAFGIYHNLCTLGLLLSAFVYSAVIGSNYRLAGFLTVITYGIAAALAFGLQEVKEQNGKKRDGKHIIQQILAVGKDRRFLLVLIGMAFFQETKQTVTVFLNQLQYERSGITPVAMGYIYILITIVGMAGIWSFRISRRIGERRFSTVLFGTGALSCFLMIWTKNPWLSVSCVAALSLASNLFWPLQTEIMNRHVKSADRATVLSIYAVLMEGTGIFTNLLFGRAAQVDLGMAMGSGAVLCVVGAVLFLVGSGSTIICR